MKENKGLSASLPWGLNFGVPGKDGATFTPSLDDEGNLSWSNDKGLPNPETKNIRGPQGPAGEVSDDKIAEAVKEYLDSGGNVDFDSLDLAFYDGKLYITVNGVRKGNGVTIGTVEDTVYHNIVLNLTNCVSSNEAVKVEEHSEYTTVISAETGFIMNSLAVTMGGESLTPENGTIHIEDVTGEIQITASAVENTGGVDLSGIVAWYQTEVQDAYNYISAMDNSKWVHHVVIADPHYGRNNAMTSPAIILALMNTGRFDKFIHLGDMFGDGLNETAVNEVLETGLQTLNGRMIYLYGAHDFISDTANYSASWYYDTFLSNADFTWGTDDHSTIASLYYTYDDAERKIRYICTNFRGNTADEHKNWLYDQIEDCEEGWTIVVLAHSESTVGAGSHITAVKDALDFKANQCAGWIAGVHRDTLTEHPMMTEMWLLLDEAIGGNDSTGADSPTTEQRVIGTVSESAISILSLNPTEGKVQVYRIGAYGTAYADKFPVIMEYDMKTNGSGWGTGYFTAAGTITRTVSKNNTFLRQYVPIDGSKPVYAGNTNPEWGAQNPYVCWAYFSDDKHSAFINRESQVLNAAPWGMLKTIPASASATHIGISFDYGMDYLETLFYTQNVEDIPIGGYTADNWSAGYNNSSGGIQSSTTEMNSGIFRVTPGKTYKFSNTNPDWASTNIKVGTWKAPDSFNTRLSINGTDNTFTFTIPDGCYFAVISCAITSDYTATATLEEVTE